MAVFDEAHWLEIIKKPDWYMEFVPYIEKTHATFDKDSEEFNQFNYTVRHFFEKTLQENKVALADHGPNLDEQREPIDTIVIHHTSNKPGYRLSYMDAVHLVNIYAPYFLNPTDDREKSLKGQPLWSGHFKDGKQVFWAYHWLMRMDGSFERLLDDNQIGWHAGNWEINKSSVGICLDNDYENQDPKDETLKFLATHIKRYYPYANRIIGHREARAGTICPGTNFIGVWKAKLLNYL